MSLEQRLAELVRDGDEFTSDDVTSDGRYTIDPGHNPNGKQNGIGALMRTWSRRGLIVWTGRVTTSRAPHRKGGMIRVWVATPAGRSWVRQWEDVS